MKDLVIIGGGDFGREVAWLVERINQQDPAWNLLGFVDDDLSIQGKVIDGYSVLGTTEWLKELEHEVYVVCSIATGRIRKLVMERVLQQEHLHPATLIDPTVIIGRGARVGEGCMICAGSLLAINAVVSDHSIINAHNTIGHDTVLEPYCTVHPGSNLSGKVRVGSCTDIGTGTKIIQGLTVCPGCIIGAGAVVAKNIEEPGTYVGVPVRRVH